MKSIKNLLDNHTRKSGISKNYIPFLKSNSKLIKDNIYHFSIMANKENCKFAGPCKFDCYAKNGFFNMPSVKKSQDRSKSESLKNTFVSTITTEIQHFNRSIIRIHSAGDFYSLDYAKKWSEIARLNPDVIFYAYVKSLPIIRQVKNLPENFLYIQSLGTVNDSKYINYNNPFARVFYSSYELNKAVEKENYIDSSERDINTVKAIIQGQNVGLLDHDVKRYEKKLLEAIDKNDTDKIFTYGHKLAEIRNKNINRINL